MLSDVWPPIHFGKSPRLARSTPFLCPNDQFHNIVHHNIRLELRNQCGLNLTLQDRPRGEKLKGFKSAAGIRKGPDEVMLASALFRVASRLDRCKVAAAFVRCGFLDGVKHKALQFCP